VTSRDRWFYPDEIAGDLRDAGLPDAVVAETLACAWEYTRCVIPQFTNWERYVAFTRIIVIGIVAEFRGALVDVTTGGPPTAPRRPAGSAGSSCVPAAAPSGSAIWTASRRGRQRSSFGGLRCLRSYTDLQRRSEHETRGDIRCEKS
jgi:hypothetical protein